MGTWTQQDIDKLKKKIAGASKKVTYGNKQIENQDLDKMLELLSVMEQDVNGTPNLKSRKSIGVFRSTLNPYRCN